MTHSGLNVLNGSCNFSCGGHICWNHVESTEKDQTLNLRHLDQNHTKKQCFSDVVIFPMGTTQKNNWNLKQSQVMFSEFPQHLPDRCLISVHWLETRLVVIHLVLNALNRLLGTHQGRTELCFWRFFAGKATTITFEQLGRFFSKIQPHIFSCIFISCDA